MGAQLWSAGGTLKLYRNTHTQDGRVGNYNWDEILGKIIKFQSNTTCIVGQMHRLHVFDEGTNSSSALNTRHTTRKWSDMST